MSRFRRRARWVMPVVILGVTLLLLVVAGPVAEALRGDLPPRGEDRPVRWAAQDLVLPDGNVVPGGLVDLFDGLGASLRVGGFDLERYWDPQRMQDEAARFLAAGGARPATPFRELAPQLARRLAFEGHAIRAVRWVVPDAEAVVLVRHLHRGADGPAVPVKQRWWVVRSPDGWRAYDAEEVGVGFRMSAHIGLAAGGLRDLRAAYDRIVARDLAAARVALDAIDPADFPRPTRGVYHFLRASVELDTKAHPAALRELAQAEEHSPDLVNVAYLRALCHYALGDHEAVVPAARAFVERVGIDGDLCWLLGRSLDALGRRDEAAAAFRQSLDDEPDLLVALDGLRGCLPANAKAELGERLLDMAEPEKGLSRLVWLALVAEDVAGAEAYVAAFREAFPFRFEGFVQGLRVCHNKKAPDQALAVYAEGLGALTAEEQEALVAVASGDFARSGGGLTFYDVTPAYLRAKALDALTDVLTYKDGLEAPPAEALKTLAELVDRHGRDQPKDRRLPFHRGRLAAARGDRDAAERHFAEATPLAADDDERAEVRAVRVYNLLDAGRPLDAYDKVPPAEATFALIADHFLRTEPAGLESVLARHKQARPGDPFLPAAEGRLGYAQRRWARALPHLRTVADRPIDPEKPFDHDPRTCGELVVRCLANLGRLDEARDALARHKERFENPPPQLDLLVEAMAGDVDAVEREVTLLLVEGWPPDGFLADPDLGPLLRTSAFDRLRAILPEPWHRR